MVTSPLNFIAQGYKLIRLCSARLNNRCYHSICASAVAIFGCFSVCTDVGAIESDLSPISGERLQLLKSLSDGAEDATRLKYLKAMETWLRTSPDDTLVLFHYGSTFFVEGRYPEASIAYARLTRLLPRSSLAFSAACEAHVLSNKPKQAIKFCKNSLELDPESSRGSVFMAHAELLAGNAIEAERIYSDAMKGMAYERALEDEIVKDLSRLAKRGVAPANTSLIIAKLRKKWNTPELVSLRKDKQREIRAAYRRKTPSVDDSGIESIDREKELAYAATRTEEKFGLRHPYVAKKFLDLAKLKEESGKYVDALSLYKQAGVILAEELGPDSSHVIPSLYGMIRMYSVLGDSDRAFALALRRHSISEASGRGIEQTGIMGGGLSLAIRFAEHGRYADSLAVINGVRSSEYAYNRTGGFGDGLLKYFEAIIRLPAGDAKRAKELIEEALPLLLPDEGMHAKALVARGDILMSFGDPHAAIFDYLSAERVLSSGKTNTIDAALVQSRLQIGFSSVRQSDVSIMWGKAAVNTMQKIRSHQQGAERQTLMLFMDAYGPIYERLAALLVSQGRIDEGQVVLQMLKEQELHEAFERSSKFEPRTTTIELTGLERKTFAEYYALRDRQAALGQEKRQLVIKDKEGGLNEAEQARLREIDTKLVPQIQAAVERFMAGLQERLHQQRKSGEKVRDLEATEARLRKAVIDLERKDPEAKVVALQFVNTDDTVSILLTTPGVPPIVRQVPIARKALIELVNQTRIRLQGRADRSLLDPQLRQLYALLIAPVEADLKAAGARTLMLSPNGVLRYVPFAALLNGSRFLVQDYNLALFTEGVATQGFETTSKRDWRLAGLGLTQEVKGAKGETLSALPNVKDELTGVLRQPKVTGQVWLDAEFDRPRLSSTLRGNYNVLHVASHFEFISGRPDASSLFLGDKSSLSLAEVGLQDIRFDNFDLVNFSACETAVGGGRDENGQELESLGAKVLQQGAGSVMATLWKVADQSTPKLMQAFYKARGDSALNKAQALRQAQLAFIEGDIRLSRAQAWDHPYYWAPFVLMGNWR